MPFDGGVATKVVHGADNGGETRAGMMLGMTSTSERRTSGVVMTDGVDGTWNPSQNGTHSSMIQDGGQRRVR